MNHGERHRVRARGARPRQGRGRLHRDRPRQHTRQIPRRHTARGARRASPAERPRPRRLHEAHADTAIAARLTSSVASNTVALRRKIAVLLCGMETPPTRGWEYTVGFHNVFPRVAKRYGVPLVPFLLTGVALVREMNGADGVHPNAAGARRIADNVWPYLEALLVID